MKKLLLTLFSMMMIFSITTIAFASETPIAVPQHTMIEVEIDYNSAVENVDGTVTYDILNAADLAMAWGIDESDIKEVKYVAFNRIDESHPAPRASISIENIEGPFEACGVDLIARNSATNYTNKTITKNITLTGTVSNSYSLSNEIGIDVEVAQISSAVGFSVTDSRSMSDSTEVVLEPGETITVDAMPLYDVYTFDVYQNSFWTGKTKVCTGAAYETVGFCTVIY